MSAKNRFLLDGHDKKDEPFHYTACGLDDIYLVSGFEKHETAYGAGVSIHKVDALHRAIAGHIILRRKTLSLKEFRFLRKEMNVTQRELGKLVGKDEQTIARYEKGESPISSSVDKLVRLVYALNPATPQELDAIREMIDPRFDVDEIAAAPVTFEVTLDGDWHERHRAA